MARYRLKDKCMFVDAYLYDEPNKRPSNQKKPEPIKCAHINDQSTSPPTYLKLNDGAAFIARFIVLRVDTDLIPKILVSEYGSNVKDPVADVKAVVAILIPYLVLVENDPFPFVRPYETPKEKGGDQHSGKYPLDFSANWFGSGGLLKGPL